MTSCLVIRLREAKGRPLFLQAAEALDPALGHEQHVYRIGPEEYTCTGLFWPVTAETVSRLRLFNVYSVDTFKRSALTKELTLPPGSVATRLWPDTALRALFQFVETARR